MPQRITEINVGPGEGLYLVVTDDDRKILTIPRNGPHIKILDKKSINQLDDGFGPGFKYLITTGPKHLLPAKILAQAEKHPENYQVFHILSSYLQIHLNRLVSGLKEKGAASGVLKPPPVEFLPQPELPAPSQDPASAHRFAASPDQGNVELIDGVPMAEIDAAIGSIDEEIDPLDDGSIDLGDLAAELEEVDFAEEEKDNEDIEPRRPKGRRGRRARSKPVIPAPSVDTIHTFIETTDIHDEKEHEDTIMADDKRSAKRYPGLSEKITELCPDLTVRIKRKPLLKQLQESGFDIDDKVLQNALARMRKPKDDDKAGGQDSPTRRSRGKKPESKSPARSDGSTNGTAATRPTAAELNGQMELAEFFMLLEDPKVQELLELGKSESVKRFVHLNLEVGQRARDLAQNVMNIPPLP